MRRLAWGAAIVAVLATACPRAGGSGPPPTDALGVLARTASTLGDIRSGTLDLVLDLERGDEPIVGFELHGPFALGAEGNALPLADIEYEQRVGSEEATSRLISTGDRAFVVIDEVAYELPPGSVETLRASGGSPDGPLGELRVDHWIAQPTLSDGGEVGGAPTQHVSGELDAARALTDLLATAQGLGASPLPSAGPTAPTGDDLTRVVERATIDVWAGRDDGLLRRLTIEVGFAGDLPDDLRTALEGIAGASFVFDLTVTSPNSEVNVDAPTDVRPFDELPVGSRVPTG